MSSLWEDVKNAIVDGYVYASDKAEEVTQISRAKVEILKLNRQIARTMSEMGGRVFELVDAGDQDALAQDEQIRTAVETIQKLRADISKWEQEIAKVRAEREQKQKAEKGQELQAERE